MNKSIVIAVLLVFCTTVQEISCMEKKKCMKGENPKGREFFKARRRFHQNNSSSSSSSNSSSSSSSSSNPHFFDSKSEGSGGALGVETMTYESDENYENYDRGMNPASPEDILSLFAGFNLEEKKQ